MIRIALVLLSSALMTACTMIPGTAAHTERLARTTLTDQLADTDSARFQNVRTLVDHTHGDPPIDIICGEVNAKNMLGAYVGFHRFIAVPAERFSRVDPVADDQSSDRLKIAQTVFDDAYRACTVAEAGAQKRA